MEMLRERIKGLERKIMEMIRNSQENLAIADRLHRWTRAVLLQREPAALPALMVDVLRNEFLIPQAAIRVWDAGDAFVGSTAAQAVSDDVRSFAASLALPYCGLNAGFEAAQWLDEDAAGVTSIALIPLAHSSNDNGRVFGLLVLGSPDPTRYSADMGTEFLVRIGEIASAALSRITVHPR